MLQDFDEESAAALLKNHSMRWSEELKKPIRRREQLSSFVNRSCMLELDKVTNSVDSVASWIYRQSLLDLRPEDVPFQELVVSYMRLHDRDSEAILWLNRMIEAGQLPTEELYEVMKSSRLQRRILRSYAIANDDDAVDAWVAFLQSCRLKPDQSVYEDMIINCIENGNTNEAVKWLQIMRKKGFEPNRETYMNIVFSGAKGNSDDDSRISMDALRQWLSMVEGLETSRIYAVLDSLLKEIAKSQSQFRFGLMEEVVGEMSKRGVEPSAQALVALYRTMGPVAAGEMCREAGFDMDNLARAMESASGRGSHMSL
jgi:pentatricopeptide repeat protein